MNERHECCEGTELTTGDGRIILDFLSGYCVHNVGHNHPEIIRQLHNESAQCGPAMLRSHVPDLAGDLAKRLCALAVGKLRKAFFACYGRYSQAAVARLYQDHGILTQVCGNNFLVLKVTPPLIVTEEQVNRFVVAARDVVHLMHNSVSFWTEAPRMARGGMNVRHGQR
jgi:4-aminobutyrate aminotransferase-like enzyme